MSSIAVSSWDYYFKYWTHVDLHLYMWGGSLTSSPPLSSVTDLPPV